MPLASASGDLTDHTKLAIQTAESLLPCKFTLKPEGATTVISCEGVGLTAPGCFSEEAKTRTLAPPPAGMRGRCGARPASC